MSSSIPNTDPLGATTDIDGEAITVSKAKGAPVTPSPTHDPGQQYSNNVQFVLNLKSHFMSSSFRNRPTGRHNRHRRRGNYSKQSQGRPSHPKSYT